jgi:hypothetical protein
MFRGCGRRLFGNRRHDRAYYMCWPRNNNRGRADKYETGGDRAQTVAAVDRFIPMMLADAGNWTP